MSKIQICNRGLSTYLGVGRISDLSESSPSAEQMELHYDDTLEELLLSHWWIFATGRQVLAELANDRPNEWGFKYQKPSEALEVRWVNEPRAAQHLIDTNQNPDAPRKMEGQFIYSNVQFAVCEFTRVVEDTTLYHMHFKNALSAKLAANSCLALTEDLKRAQNAMNAADQMLEEAIVFDEAQLGEMRSMSMPDSLSVRGIR